MKDNTTNTIKCSSCDSEELRLIGRIPFSNKFAGKIFSYPVGGGELYECKKCGVQFRYPIPSKVDLDTAYRLGNDTNWGAGARNDWDIVSKMILENTKTGKILDIGCFDGGFLKTLGEKFSKYGIEVHKIASDKARQNGVNILCDDFDHLSEINETFDVVVAIDVIEHVVNPRKFISEISTKLSPGGILIISTGNTHSLTWRFMGSSYWYCVNPEHISFINPSWCNESAQLNGLEMVGFQSFSYRNGGFFQKTYDFIKNVSYKAYPGLFSRLRIMGFGKRNIKTNKDVSFYPPTWLTARDHLAVMFKKA